MNLNHEQVVELIPQRDPLLLVDTVEDLEPGKSCVGKFYVSAEMPVFAGHFPGNPVLPGVYQLECAAQVSSLLFVTLDRYKGMTPLYLGVNNASFKKMVKPGDTLTVFAETTKEREDKGLSFTHVVLKVGEDVVSETDVVLAYR